MRRLLGPVVGIVVFVMLSRATIAHSEFSKALKAKYGLKSVSCYRCHSRKGEAVKDLDTQLRRILKGRTTKQLADAKDLPPGDREKRREVKDKVRQEFLEALKKVESNESKFGSTYGEQLKQGTLDGVKRKE
jgi:hypothetical protein